MTLKQQAAQRAVAGRAAAVAIIKAVLTGRADSAGRLCGITVIAAVIGLACAISAQTISPEGRFTIPLSNLQSKPYDIRVRSKDGKARVELKAGGNKLMFMRLVENKDSPSDTKISVEGQPESYNKDELLHPGLWYPFKVSLPLVFAMKADDKPQLGELEIGELPENVQLPKTMGKARQIEPEQINKVGRSIYYQLTYDAQPIISVKPESLSFTIDESKGLQSTDNELLLEDMATGNDKGGWTFFRVKPQIQVGDFKVQVADVSGEATVAAGSPVEMSQWYGFKGGIKLRVSVQEPRPFQNEMNVGAVLEVEAGRALLAPQTREDAIGAAKNAAGIEPRGAVAAVQTTVRVTPQPTWTDWVFGHLGLLMGLAAIGAAMILVVLWLLQAWKDKKWMRQQDKGQASSSVGGMAGQPNDYDYDINSPRPDSTPTTIVMKGQRQGIGQKIFGKLKRSTPEEEEANARQKEKQRQYMEEVNRRKTAVLGTQPPAAEQAAYAGQSTPTPPPYAGEPAPTGQPYTGQPAQMSQPVVTTAASTSSRDGGREVGELRERLQRLEDQIRSSRGDGSTASVPPAVRNYVKDAIEHFYNKTKGRDRESILNDAQKEVADLERRLGHRLTEMNGALTKQASDAEVKHREVKQIHETSQKMVLDQIQADQEETRRMLEALRKQMMDELAQVSSRQDRFYSGVLGMIFGQNVDALREGNFEASIKEAGDKLNQFFKEEIPRPEVLSEQASKAYAISRALHEVFEKTKAVSGGASQGLLGFMESADSLTKELNMLQAQLRERQFPVTGSPIRIPVAAHPNARYNFLEELGLAIKREIDKLRDPQAYFKRSLEKLITSDLIAVADICDKQTRPGSNRDLEQALANLFESAGLTCIMPRPGDPFKPGEQNLILIIPGSPSQTIAEVVTRGFRYGDEGQEKLLRKAGVSVYR